MKTQKEMGRRFVDMAERLQQFNFDIHYIPGPKLVVADALSRNPIDPVSPSTDRPLVNPIIRLPTQC